MLGALGRRNEGYLDPWSLLQALKRCGNKMLAFEYLFACLPRLHVRFKPTQHKPKKQQGPEPRRSVHQGAGHGPAAFGASGAVGGYCGGGRGRVGRPAAAAGGRRVGQRRWCVRACVSLCSRSTDKHESDITDLHTPTHHHTHTRTQGAFSAALLAPPATSTTTATSLFPLPVRARKRLVFSVHCPNPAAPPAARCPLVIDPSGVYFRSEGGGEGHFICGVSPAGGEVRKRAGCCIAYV